MLKGLIKKRSELWTLKWQKIHTCQQLNLENKLSKQEQRHNHGYGEGFDGCQMGGRCRGMGEEGRELISTNSWLQNSHGNVKYSIGKGVAKEFIHMTHGHEQWWRDCPRESGCWVEGEKGGKLGQLS